MTITGRAKGNYYHDDEPGPEPEPVALPAPAYRFDVSCPFDGGQLEHRADGRPEQFATRAIAHCPRCSATFIVVVELRVHAPGRRAVPA